MPEPPTSPAGSEAGANPLWDFSLRLYGEPGVAEACLALQDRLGADVNLLLFCCWAGQRGQALGEADLDRLQAVAAPWQRQVVAPLRSARRWLKGQGGAGAEALREEIKRLELEAERLEQDRLQAVLPLPDGPASLDSAAMNLERYLARLDGDASEEIAPLLAALRRLPA